MADQDSVLVFLSIPSQDPRWVLAEAAFEGELGLELEGFRIEHVNIDNANFCTLPLQTQLEKIRPYAEKHGAAATVWLENTTGDNVLLHLVALSSGRALVRIIEVGPGPQSASRLALATKELLAQAYLFSLTPRTDAVAEVVEEVHREVISEPPDHLYEGVDGAAPVHILSYFQLAGGAMGHQGSSTYLGGGFAVEPWFIDRVFLRVGLEAGATLGGERAGLNYRSRRLSGEALLGLGWRSGPFRFRVFGGAGALFSRMFISGSVARDQKFDRWFLRICAGLDMSVDLSDTLSLVVILSAGVFTEQEEYVRKSNLATILRTPRIDWVLSLGFDFSIG